MPPPPPRSSGVPARGHTERSQPASGVAAAPRPRAAGAPAARACAPAARPRAARAGACTHSNAPCPGSGGGGWWWVAAQTFLEASQNLGKYQSYAYGADEEIPLLPHTHASGCHAALHISCIAPRKPSPCNDSGRPSLRRARPGQEYPKFEMASHSWPRSAPLRGYSMQVAAYHPTTSL